MCDAKKQCPMLSLEYLYTKMLQVIEKQYGSIDETEHEHEPNEILHEKNLHKFFDKVKKIQKRWMNRGDHFEDTTVKYPKTICFKTVDDFYKDTSKYRNALIEFPAGGKVGDNEWQIQYMHNSSVLSDYHDRRFPKKPVILFHYIIVPKQSEEIEIYIDDMLLSKYPCNYLHLRDNVINIIKPDISYALKLPVDHVVYFIDTHGFDDYHKDGHTIKCMCDKMDIPIHFINEPEIKFA